MGEHGVSLENMEGMETMIQNTHIGEGQAICAVLAITSHRNGDVIEIKNIPSVMKCNI